MIAPLFKETDLKPKVELAEPAEITFNGYEYTFKCPACGKDHTNVCMAKKGDPIVLTTSVGAAMRSGFASGSLDKDSSYMLSRILKPHNAELLAAVSCPNASTTKEMAKKLDKRDEVIEGFRKVTRALLNHYEPSRIITLGRHAYEVVTGRSVPDASVYGSYTFYKDVPVVGLPAPGLEMLAPFRKKRFEKALVEGLTGTFKRLDSGVMKLKRVATVEDAEQAVKQLRSGRFLYFDVEYAGDPYGRKFRLLCLAARCPDQDTVYLWSEEALKDRSLTKDLIDALADPNVKLGAHNAKAEWLACTQYFPELKLANGLSRMKNLYADSMLLVYMLGLGGRVGLSICTEYVGLGGQKDVVKEATGGVGKLINYIRGEIRKGQTYEQGLDSYKAACTKKLTTACKKALVEKYREEGHALKVCRALAIDEITRTAAGEDTEIKDTWLGILYKYGDPKDSELLRDAVENPQHDTGLYSYGLINTELLENYCAKDVYTGSEVAVWAGRKVVNTPGVREAWFKVVAPGTEVISQMERNGVPTSAEQLRDVIYLVQKDMDDAEEKLRELGFEGSLSSPKDLGRHLFEVMKLEPIILTPKDAPSVSSDALDALIEQDPDSPVMKLLQDYNKAAKVKNSFGESLIHKIAVDGCIHGSFHTDGTAAGRLSASDPNMQQLPSRNEYAKGIKSAFMGLYEGQQGILIQLDYSQIELRIAAALSGDQAMIEAFKSGEDFHWATAHLVWGGEGIEITSDHRKEAKAINFGLIYNKGLEALAKEIKKSKEAAADIKEAILGKYPDLDKSRQGWQDFAKKNGYCRTYLWDEEKNEWYAARVRHMLDIDHKIGKFASVARNGSVNSPVQGTAGDFTIMALVKIDKWIRESGAEAKIVLTVHDSIVVISSFKDALRVAMNCKRLMEEVSPAGVPLVADCELGLNYGVAHPIKDVIAGAAALARGMPKEDAAKIANILQSSPEFGILENLAPTVGNYAEAA